ncbi:MAG: lipid-A-disaccharide synthase [Deltaproteobacteria bacterium]|nr:lipid-A-disaccharide synthase [Deltaproteobacteria bacterium]
MEPFAGSPLRIFLSAGEASGDLHGSRLVRAIWKACPEASITCMGGPLLEEAGARIVVPNRDVAVVGLSEVLVHLKSVARAFSAIRSHLSAQRPHVAVLIDFPDFNFLVGRLARKLGIRVFYYISPQVWAWRSGRVQTMKRFVDDMAVILPFEPEFYARRGMPVRYVGHPLLDVLNEAPTPKEARLRYGCDEKTQTVGILPGSRTSEVRLLLALFCEAATILKDRMPGVRFLLPVAPSLDKAWIESQVIPFQLPVRLVRGDTYGVIRACDLLITASGTVTLEAAVLGTPMIIANRVSAITYHVGRHLIRVRHIGLPNLIAGREIVPEFVQLGATPSLLAQEVLQFLQAPHLLERQRSELGKIRERLGSPGVADRVAALVLEQARQGKASEA